MAKKKKKKIVPMRNVTVTKTKVIKGSAASDSSGGSNKYMATFAGLKFHVKVDKKGMLDILTFQDATREMNAVWEEHRIIGQTYPEQEFIGMEAESFNMTIVLDRQFGQSPHGKMKKLHKFMTAGKHSELHIGSHKIGKRWKIETISEAYNKIYHNGQLTKATVDLTISTYS